MLSVGAAAPVAVGDGARQDFGSDSQASIHEDDLYTLATRSTGSLPIEDEGIFEMEGVPGSAARKKTNPIETLYQDFWNQAVIADQTVKLCDWESTKIVRLRRLELTIVAAQKAGEINQTEMKRLLEMNDAAIVKACEQAYAPFDAAIQQIYQAEKLCRNEHAIENAQYQADRAKHVAQTQYVCELDGNFKRYTAGVNQRLAELLAQLRALEGQSSSEWRELQRAKKSQQDRLAAHAKPVTPVKPSSDAKAQSAPAALQTLTATTPVGGNAAPQGQLVPAVATVVEPKSTKTPLQQHGLHKPAPVVADSKIVVTSASLDSSEYAASYTTAPAIVTDYFKAP